ncbi:MAG TPA: glycosyltransferase [Thermoanaerobaculia bacterium]|nr:glycosyltransferase [Thermoanaerobaculia bacterium]
MITVAIFSLLSLIGTFLTTIQSLLTLRFRRRQRPFASGRRNRTSQPAASSTPLPFLSILKPVCGLDDDLEGNLLSFTKLRGVDYELLISIESADDPAIPIVRRVIAAHPWISTHLVIGGGGEAQGVVNRKIERLVAAARVARGDIFLVSDSNVRVERDDVRQTVDLLRDPAIGCVSNLFTGAGARTLGATIESLHLAGFVVPGSVLAAAAGVPCVVGKSMALTRRAHDAIGGFEAFRHVLAEDQAIGLAVKRAGYEVVLSPVVVRNIVIDRSVGRALDRQIRWNKIRYAFSRSLYAAEIVLNPSAFATTAFLLSLAVAPGSALPLSLAVFLVAAARILQLAIIARTTKAPLSRKQILLTPLLDVLMLAAYVVPFFSNEITWRGHRARIGPGTELIAAERRMAEAA